MSDFKSKLPDLKELGSMTSKLFDGIKNSVNEIISDYKQKREVQEAQEKADEALKAKEAQVTPEAKDTAAEKVVEPPIPPVDPIPPVEPPPPIIADEMPNQDEKKD